MRRTVCVASILLWVAALSASGQAAAPKEPPRYWLGTSFAGLALTATPGGSFIYGDCELPEGEGGCAPPLAVQNATSCGRNPLALDVLPERVTRLRGGGLMAVYSPTSIDVGSGRRTVTVFADSRDLAAGAARQIRRRSQPAALPLRPPIYPPVVLREIKRVTAAEQRLDGVRAIARATGLSAGRVRLRLRIARLLGPSALAGVPAPTRSWAEVERRRQLSFQAQELGLKRTARRNEMSVAALRAAVRSVRGLFGGC